MLKSLLSAFTPNVWPVELHCMKKIHVSSQFRPQGAQTIIFFDDISAVMGLKIEKVGPSFSTFNPCLSLSFIVTGDRKQSQCLNKVLLHFSKTCKFWSLKANWHLHFLLQSIILADLLGNRPSRVQKVMVCDWLISIALCVSVVQGSLLVIVIIIDSSKKINSEGGFST